MRLQSSGTRALKFLFKLKFEPYQSAGYAGPFLAYLTAIAFPVALALSIASAVVYYIYNLNEFADGSLFTFLVFSKNPWGLYWSNFPTRFSAYVIEALIPNLILSTTGSSTLAMSALKLLWPALSAFSLGSSYLILPRTKRYQIAFPALWFCTVGFLTLGFPTEVWITQALFWPLIFATLYLGDGLWQKALYAIMIFSFAYSHFASILSFPVIFLAIYVRYRRACGLQPFRWKFLVVAAALFALVLTKVLFPPSNPEVAYALKQNVYAIIDPWPVLGSPMFLKILAMLAASGASLFALSYTNSAPERRSFALMVALILILAGLAYIAIPAHIDTGSRYQFRSLLFCALPLAGALFIIEYSIDPGHGFGRHFGWLGAFSRGVTKTVVIAAIPLAALQFAELLQFSRGFSQFRNQLRETVSNEAAPIPRGQFISIPKVNPRHPRFSPKDWSFSWGWSLPYESVISANNLTPVRILGHSGRNFLPFSCGKSGYLIYLPPPARSLITRYNCSQIGISGN